MAAKKDVTESSPSPARRGVFSSPLAELHREVDRLFDDFMTDFRPWRSGVGFWGDGKGELVAKVDVSETDNEIQVTADLPGIDEKDIEVTLSDGVLTIKGERKAEKEEKDEKKSYHRIERSSGLYSRSIALPSEVDESKVKADFAKGVLTVRMPKSAQARSKVKKISIKAA
jgi:HSP20 family protein